jgi:KDO2-lipid IV(A) lauroyltransferase
VTALLYTLLILPLSRLPMSALYVFSDGLSALVFYVFKYRRRVVEENLARSFPERSAEERHAIAHDFYRHLGDLIVESLKSFTISNEEIQRRFRITNPEIFEPSFRAGRSIALAGGHYNNWEWFAMAVRNQIAHRAAAIYKPLSNGFLDEKIRATRGRFGLELVAMRAVPEYLRTNLASMGATPFALVFAGDQSPGDPRKAHWTTFLNQDTGVLFGAEKYAKEYDLPVFFGITRKIARGHYETEFSLVTEAPRATGPGEIVGEIARRLETEIRREPRYWLWSHRRWKHRRPADR